MKISLSNRPKILNRKDVYVGDQLKTTGQIELTKDTELQNNANIGKDYREKMVQPLYLTVPKGTLVDYMMQETRSGFYHEISYRHKGQRFTLTKSTETLGGRKPN